MALRVLHLIRDALPLGKKWTEGFIMHNPQVVTYIGVPIDTKRLRCSQLEKMKPFFKQHLNLLTQHHIFKEDI